MDAPGRSTLVLLNKVDKISDSLNPDFLKDIFCVLHITMYNIRFKWFGDPIKCYLLWFRYHQAWWYLKCLKLKVSRRHIQNINQTAKNFNVCLILPLNHSFTWNFRYLLMAKKSGCNKTFYLGKVLSDVFICLNHPREGGGLQLQTNKQTNETRLVTTLDFDPKLLIPGRKLNITRKYLSTCTIYILTCPLHIHRCWSRMVVKTRIIRWVTFVICLLSHRPWHNMLFIS